MAPMKNFSFMVLLKAAAPVSTSLVLIEAIVGKTVGVGFLLLSLLLSSSLSPSSFLFLSSWLSLLLSFII